MIQLSAPFVNKKSKEHFTETTGLLWKYNHQYDNLKRIVYEV